MYTYTLRRLQWLDAILPFFLSIFSVFLDSICVLCIYWFIPVEKKFSYPF